MRLLITITLWAIYFIVALFVVVTLLEMDLYNINYDKYWPTNEVSKYYVIDEMDV